MKIFNVYFDGKKKEIEISKVEKTWGSVTIWSKFNGMSCDGKMLNYGGGHKKPFINFADENKNYTEVELTQEIIEYLWSEIGSPYCGILYSYTNNYHANWED